MGLCHSRAAASGIQNKVFRTLVSVLSGLFLIVRVGARRAVPPTNGLSIMPQCIESNLGVPRGLGIFPEVLALDARVPWVVPQGSRTRGSGVLVLKRVL